MGKGTCFLSRVFIAKQDRFLDGTPLVGGWTASLPAHSWLAFDVFSSAYLLGGMADKPIRGTIVAIPVPVFFVSRGFPLGATTEPPLATEPVDAALASIVAQMAFVNALIF